MTRLEISGVATEEESAAIAAVVAHVLAREAELASVPFPRPQQSDWVMAWRLGVPQRRTEPERRMGVGNDDVNTADAEGPQAG